MSGGRVRKEWGLQEGVKRDGDGNKREKSSLGKEGLGPWNTPLGSRECPCANCRHLWELNLSEVRASCGGQGCLLGHAGFELNPEGAEEGIGEDISGARLLGLRWRVFSPRLSFILLCSIHVPAPNRTAEPIHFLGTWQVSWPPLLTPRLKHLLKTGTGPFWSLEETHTQALPRLGSLNSRRRISHLQ